MLIAHWELCIRNCVATHAPTHLIQHARSLNSSLIWKSNSFGEPLFLMKKKIEEKTTQQWAKNQLKVTVWPTNLPFVDRIEFHFQFTISSSSPSAFFGQMERLIYLTLQNKWTRHRTERKEEEEDEVEKKHCLCKWVCIIYISNHRVFRWGFCHPTLVIICGISVMLECSSVVPHNNFWRYHRQVEILIHSQFSQSFGWLFFFGVSVNTHLLYTFPDMLHYAFKCVYCLFTCD